MKFGCDRTLGRLAKWLRLLGYDTIYWNNLHDDILIEKCISENRVLLTKNTKLLKRIGNLDKKESLVFHFISQNNVKDQLATVVKVFHLSIGANLQLCSSCNVVVRDVKKEKVEGNVPDFVFAIQDTFKECPSCGKIFWKGSHVTRMKSLLTSIFKAS